MLTQSRLKELLIYCQETGEFTWKVSRKVKAGSVAGSQQNRGYMQIRVDYKRYLSHRLAWLYMTGEWPNHEVDHIDGNGKNNAWSNLRAALIPENRWNAATRSDNTSGHKGIEVKKTVRGSMIVKASLARLGKTCSKSFSVSKYGEEEGIRLAKEWLAEKRSELHGEFACQGSRSSQI